MSDDFFKSFEANDTSNTPAAVRPRRKAPPPPPPRGQPRTVRPLSGSAAAAPAAASSSNSYYSQNSTSRSAAGAPPPPPARTARPVIQSRRPAPQARMTAASAGSAAVGGSYYNNQGSSVPTAAAANPYASSRVAPSSQQFYSQQPNQQQPQEDTADDWFQDDHQQTHDPHQGVSYGASSEQQFGQAQQQPGLFQQPGQFGKQNQAPGQFGQQQPRHFGGQQQQQQPNEFGQQTQQTPGQFGQQSQDFSSGLEGTMDGGASRQQNKPNVFVPTMKSSQSGSSFNSSDYDFENEPPLLEELGINPEHILLKVKAVVLPSQRIWGSSSALMDPSLIVDDADLAGPAVFALALGGELLLTGKIHFGYIYGFGLSGCLAMTLLINLLSPEKPVSFWTIMSILGYSLLPVNILALVKIFVMNLAHFATLGQVLGVATVIWSTAASTRLLEVGCQLRDQRYLLAYPLAMLYSAFVLITIF